MASATDTNDPLAWLREAAAGAPTEPAVRTLIRKQVEDLLANDPRPWMIDAECFGMDPDIFFPVENEAYDPRAEATCRRCAVLGPCREYAIKNEDQGWWGGMSERARRRARRSMKIVLSDREPDEPTILEPDEVEEEAEPEEAWASLDDLEGPPTTTKETA